MKLNPDFLVHETGDGAILLATGESEKRFHGVIKLNGTGLAIVKSLEEETSLEAIVSSLSKAYPLVKKEELREDVSSFLKTLEEAGALAE